MTKPALPRFSAADAERAHETWGANCGPGAIAAICGLTLAELRPHMGDFESKRYTNPTLMYGILGRLGVSWAHRRDKDWPDWGLVRIQWTGPWTRPGVPAKAAYRHTHWVGACRHVPIGGPAEIGVFDINMMNNGSGWGSLGLWSERLVPWLLDECEPRADGGWFKTHVLEVDRPAVTMTNGVITDVAGLRRAIREKMQ